MSTPDPNHSYENKVAPFRILSGYVIDLNSINMTLVDIESIAHALSQLNRFGGHTPFPYSVATHSVLVSMLLSGTQYEYEGLMHDVTEGCGCVDLPSPVKKQCPDYKAFEKRVRYRLSSKFQISPVEPAQVKIADLTARKLEQHYLQSVAIPADYGISPTDLEIGKTFLTQEIRPSDSKEMFLQRYAETRPKLS
jgi:hypothetical protein